MDTHRGLRKVFRLNLLTLGLYSIVFYFGISTDTLMMAGRYGGKKTMQYCRLFFRMGTLPLGIGYFVRFRRLSARIGAELGRRGISHAFGARTFWPRNVFGALILIGPFLYTHTLTNASNALAEHYYQYG